MKDENGAVLVQASRQIPSEDIVKDANIDYERKAKDDIANMIGEEVAKHFEIYKETPPWLNGSVYHTELIVMTKEDYKKLSEAAWKYKDLTK